MNVPLTLGRGFETSGSSAVGHVLRAGQSGETSGKLVRAAQYVRMSTEHQKYSTENQAEALQHYAAQRGIEIVRTYADEGKSGLSLDGRDALIPAIVVEANTQDCMVMSLVENLARRQHRAIDLLHDIQGLKRRGYNNTTIAQKTGLTIEYVKAVLRLLQNGEHRLLRAVPAPLEIASAGPQAVAPRAAARSGSPRRCQAPAASAAGEQLLLT